jgi:MFS family permease
VLLSIEKARNALPKFWWSIAGMNALALVAVLFSLFRGNISTYEILMAMAAAACIGFAMGMYLTFRSTFNSAYGMCMFFYLTIIIELMLAGGAAAAATWQAGRSEIRCLAFFTNALCIVLALLGGAFREAKALEWWRADSEGQWRKRIEKYINYQTHQVHPELTSNPTDQAGVFKSPMTVVAIGAANIPLIFELYGGGRSNAIFIAALLLTATFSYVNIKTIGPGFVRLLLLRKIEQSMTSRFVNADLEKIQELRRGFFLSRWLMRDYAAPQSTKQARGPLKPQKNRK